MKVRSIYVVMACAIFFQALSVSATVAFSSLNTNDIFQSVTGAIVSGGQSSYGYYAVAYEFVPLVSGNVSRKEGGKFAQVPTERRKTRDATGAKGISPPSAW